MANPVWPSILDDEDEDGCLLENGYSRAPRFKNPSTEMDDGPPWSRRQSRIRARSETMQWVMSPRQGEVFEEFVDIELKDATLRFDMPTSGSPRTTSS